MKESRVGGHSFTHWCLWIRWPLAWLQPLKLVVVPWAWTTGVQGHTHFWNSSAASTDSGSTQHPGKTTLHKHFIETCNRRTKNGPEDESKRKISTLCSLCGFFYSLNPAQCIRWTLQKRGSRAPTMALMINPMTIALLKNIPSCFSQGLNILVSTTLGL